MQAFRLLLLDGWDLLRKSATHRSALLQQLRRPEIVRGRRLLQMGWKKLLLILSGPVVAVIAIPEEMNIGRINAPGIINRQARRIPILVGVN